MKKFIFVVFASLALIGTAGAQSVWDGNTDADGGDGVSWHDPLNWSEDVVPTGIASIPGAVVNPTIQLHTAVHNAPATTTCASVVATADCTLQINGGKDMYVNHCDFHYAYDTAGATLDIQAPSTFTLENDTELSKVRVLTGDGKFVKTGVARCDTASGVFTTFINPDFTGEIEIDEGLFGAHSWNNGSGGYDEAAYFPNATITIRNDGMMAGTSRYGGLPEIWGELILDGNGMGGLAVDVHEADPEVTWLVKRGSFKRYIEEGNTGVGPYANPVALLSTSGFICAHTRGWESGSGQDTELSGTVSGTGTLIKMGESALILSGTVTNSGSDCVEVREGCLIVEGSITGGDVVVDAPTPWANAGHHWAWSQSDYVDDYKKFQPNLGGVGTIAHTLKVLDGGWLFPEKSMPDPTQTLFPSNLTVGDAEIGAATWEVTIDALPAAGVPGTNWDYLTVTAAAGPSATGTLDLDGTTIRVRSSLADPGFDCSWQIAEADTVTGTWSVDWSDFPAATGGFSVTTGSPELWLHYDDDPAPPELEGDVTGDCIVNVLDMIAVRNHLYEDPASGDNARYDLTGDAVINVLDMIVVRNNVRNRCP